MSDVKPRTNGRPRRLDLSKCRISDVRDNIAESLVVSFEASDEIRGKGGQHAGMRLLGDEMTESGQGHAGRPSLIDEGRHAGLHSDHVRVHAESARDVLLDVRVSFDHDGSTAF
jgi:hypothetical protein